MDIELQTNDPDAALVLQPLQPYSTYSGFAARVAVRSGGFAGEAIISTRPDQFQRFVADLAAMNRSLRGTAKFESDYEEHFIEFAVGPTGSVIVSGALFHYAGLSQALRFGFHTDQTCLAPLIRDLQGFAQLAAT